MTRFARVFEIFIKIPFGILLLFQVYALIVGVSVVLIFTAFADLDLLLFLVLYIIYKKNGNKEILNPFVIFH